MIWTIMPESVFTNEAAPPEPKEFFYKNRKVLCCPMEHNQFCIIRIISSNPRDFLDQRLQPGTIVSGRELIFDK